jgi:hypothetical protein
LPLVLIEHRWSPHIAPAVREIHAYWRAAQREPAIEVREMSSHSKRTHYPPQLRLHVGHFDSLGAQLAAQTH